jgi:hypothetical protein
MQVVLERETELSRSRRQNDSGLERRQITQDAEAETAQVEAGRHKTIYFKTRYTLDAYLAIQ